ncbi:MAG: TPM domain-containing protein, partial [Cyanobacteria bacterium P01_A01_bin.70]
MSSSHLTAPLTWSARLRRYRFWLLGCVTAIALFLPSLTMSVQAQAAYPPLNDPYVNDYAEVLAAEDKANLRNDLEAFRAQTGIHAVVMTIQSIHDYATGDTSIESFATNTFNTWGLGDATRNDGILLLVAPGDREVRIELGRGYGRQDDRIAQAIIDDAMLPFFRENQISLGTVAGTSAIIDQFDPNRPRPHPVANFVKNVSLPSGPESGIAVLATLAAGGGVA